MIREFFPTLDRQRGPSVQTAQIGGVEVRLRLSLYR